ncbi:MAG: hypothetical protein ABSB80_06225 [Methanoregula sp.]|jgi:membrane-associated HD superfamily phosphohydrolase|uniref:hypothetical protein n=1 Tax=Methanoregula sp. TaxID=2052170 RepID=UPI003D0BE6DC
MGIVDEFKVCSKFICQVLGAIFFTLLAIIIASFIATSNITYTFPLGYINEIANACILVSSITLATIYAIITIIVTKPSKNCPNFVPVSIIPIVGIITGVLALTLSPFSDTFVWAKNVLVISVIFTFSGFTILYLLMFQVKLPYVPKIQTSQWNKRLRVKI